MNIIKKILLKIVIKLDNMKLIRLSDICKIKTEYYCTFEKKLDLDNLKTFNEKIQWLKLYDRRNIYTTMVDKYEAKKYVANIIGEEHIVPTIGIYDKFDDINFDKLPNQFVIKCTHDSGGVVIVKDKSKIDLISIKKKINKYLKRKYFYIHREWPYKNVKPRIIIEKYLENNDKELTDYKFMCFNGVPKVLYVSECSHTDNQKIAFFDMNYNQLDIKRYDYKDYDVLPNKPKSFEKMKKFASELSKNISHLRVDFYEIDGNVYFGEMTFYTGSGLIPFKDEKWNFELGKYLDV